MAADDNLFSASLETEKFLCDRLIDPAQPISERFRALFSLRNLRGPAPRQALILGLFPVSHSWHVLLQTIRNLSISFLLYYLII